jgi:hypothetical protein
MAAISVTSGGDLRSASRALYEYTAETFLARSFSERFGISGNLGDDLWSTLPPAQGAEFRCAALDHSHGKPRDGTEERVLAALVPTRKLHPTVFMVKSAKDRPLKTEPSRLIGR